MDPREQSQTIVATLRDYVADRLHIPPGTLARDDVMNQLRQRKFAETDLATLDELLHECEATAYGGAVSSGGRSMLDRAESCLNSLERSRLA